MKGSGVSYYNNVGTTFIHVSNTPGLQLNNDRWLWCLREGDHDAPINLGQRDSYWVYRFATRKQLRMFRFSTTYNDSGNVEPMEPIPGVLDRINQSDVREVKDLIEDALRRGAITQSMADSYEDAFTRATSHDSKLGIKPGTKWTTDHRDDYDFVHSIVPILDAHALDGFIRSFGTWTEYVFIHPADSLRQVGTERGFGDAFVDSSEEDDELDGEEDAGAAGSAGSNAAAAAGAAGGPAAAGANVGPAAAGADIGPAAAGAAGKGKPHNPRKRWCVA
jgi:hypothetical protein